MDIMGEVYENLTALAASPETDSLEVDADTLTVDEGERLLHLYEAAVIEGYATMKRGASQATHALYQILEGGLWHFAMNKQTGLAFGDEEEPKKENYVRQLADDIGVSRSTLFAKQATLRVATNGMGLSLDQIEGIGVSRLDTTRALVDYNREDGTITGVPGAEIPDGVEPGEHVRQVVLETSRQVDDEHLKPKDFRRLLKQRLGVEEPELSFFYVENGNGRFNLGVDFADADGTMILRGVIWECNHDRIPQYVKDKLIAKLRMTSL